MVGLEWIGKAGDRGGQTLQQVETDDLPGPAYSTIHAVQRMKAAPLTQAVSGGWHSCCLWHEFRNKIADGNVCTGICSMMSSVRGQQCSWTRLASCVIRVRFMHTWPASETSLETQHACRTRSHPMAELKGQGFLVCAFLLSYESNECCRPVLTAVKISCLLDAACAHVNCLD